MARVLVTRPEPGASATARRLEALGHEVVTEPLFTVHSVEWTPPGEAFDALMLTSANAVRLAGPLPGRWRALPCYAVGKATAQVAETHGFINVFTSTGDAEMLAGRMAADGVATALHLAGREHRRIAALRPHILTRIVYAADPVERLDDGTIASLAAGTVSHVLLYSPRAATRFALLADQAGLDRNGMTLGALSPLVAEAAGPGWRAVAVAAEPREDQLFAACGLLCDKPTASEQRDRE